MLYEELYCARVDMENRIREHRYDLFAKRTSSRTLPTRLLKVAVCVCITVRRLLAVVSVGVPSLTTC